MICFASIALVFIASFATKGQTQQFPFSWMSQGSQYSQNPVPIYNNPVQYPAPAVQVTYNGPEEQAYPQNPYPAQPQHFPAPFNNQPAPTNSPARQNPPPPQNANGPITGVSSYNDINLKSPSAHGCARFMEGRVYCDGNGKSDCEQKGCCYDTTYPNLIPCFYHPGMAEDAPSKPTSGQGFYIPKPQDSAPPAPHTNPRLQETAPNRPRVSGDIVPPISGGDSPPSNSQNNAPPFSPSSQDPARQLPPASGESAPPSLPPFLSDLLQNGQFQFPDFGSTSQNPVSQGQPYTAPSRLPFGPATPGKPNNTPLPFKPVPVPSKIAFSGCLLHCTSMPPRQRRVCVPEVGKDICLRVGCCFDEAAKICFHSNPIKDSCPSHDECKLPLGPVQPCGSPGLPKLLCEAQGCCHNQISGVSTCYRKQQPQRRELPPTPPPTAATTESTTKLDLLEKLKQLQAELGGGPTTTPSKSLGSTRRPILEQAEISPKAAGFGSAADPPQQPTAAPPETSPTPSPVTRPPYRPPPTFPPQYRQQCDRRGRCQYTLMPPRTCFPQKCGDPVYTPNTIKNSFDPRKIVGGSRAFPFSHPWTVMIQKAEGNRTYICGATLICRQWIVTAAHCLDRQRDQKSTPDLDPNMYKIFVGRWAGWQSIPGKQVQVFKGNDIEVMVQHEKFIPGKHRGVITHDIALIKLRKLVRLDDFTQPACLPTQPASPGEVMFATGWGISKNYGPKPTSLKQVGVLIRTQQDCRNRVPGFENPVGVICGGGEPSHDTCTGDSGGPLVGAMPGKKIRLGTAAKPLWHIFGLTSIGSPSCNTDPFDRQPALYTDIFYFLGWIKYMTGNCCA